MNSKPIVLWTVICAAGLVALLALLFVVDGYARLRTYEDLREAACSGNTAVLKSLLKKGADPNFEGDDELTPLMCAVYNDREEAARLLVAHGANVRYRSPSGKSPLSEAAYSPKLRRWLISVGATR